MQTRLRDEDKYGLPYHWLHNSESFFGVHYGIYTEQLVGMLPGPPLKLLDAGCGDGKLADLLVRRQYTVTGVDLVERAVAFARILVPGATFHRCDLTSLDRYFPQCSFDAVVLNAVLEHIPPAERGGVLRGIHGMIGNGGTLVLSVPTPRLPQSPYHYSHFELDDIQRLLRESGFSLEHVLFSHNMRHITTRLLLSPWMKLIHNRLYTLTSMRRALLEGFRSRAAEVRDAKSAGMLIIRSRKA